MAVSQRERVLWVALFAVVCVAVAVLGARHWRELLGPIFPEITPPERHSATREELDEIRGYLDAEKTADRFERCLTYPNPSGSRWDAKVVDAFCRLSLRKMISWKEIKTALDEHRPEVLQRAFDSYLSKTYEPGQHGFLTWTYWWMFQNPSAEEEKVTQQWVDEDPDSAYALVARGTHYVAAAWKTRGSKLAKETSKENFARMNEFLDKAAADFHEALRRNHRLIAAYHGMFNIAQLRGDSGLLRSTVRHALKLDPADQWVYDDWFDNVEPRWGGSSADMLGVVEEATKHADENPLLDRIRARPMCYVAEMTECTNCGSRESIKGRALQALHMYEEAGSDTPATCFLQRAAYAAETAGDDVSLVRYASQTYRFLDNEDQALRRALALQRLGKPDWGLESVDHLLATNPRHVQALTYRGWLLDGLGRPKDAEQAFLAVVGIEPANRYANTELVRLYVDKLNEPDKAADVVSRLKAANPKNPRVWLLEAALHRPGSDDAACRDALQKYLELVDQNDSDAYEQRDIERAKSRLTELNRKL